MCGEENEIFSHTQLFLHPCTFILQSMSYQCLINSAKYYSTNKKKNPQKREKEKEYSQLLLSTTLEVQVMGTRCHGLKLFA